jgi:hypothetical protein
MEVNDENKKLRALLQERVDVSYEDMMGWVDEEWRYLMCQDHIQFLEKAEREFNIKPTKQ